MVGEIVVVLFVVFVVARVAWWSCSLVLRWLSGLFLFAAMLGVIAGRPVPGVILVMIVVPWVVGHAIIRVRHGYWRNRTLGRLAARWAATGAAGEPAYVGSDEEAGPAQPGRDPGPGPRGEGPPRGGGGGATLYDVLGACPDATREELRRAYHVRCQLLHPDRHAGARPRGDRRGRAGDAPTQRGLGSVAPRRCAPPLRRGAPPITRFQRLGRSRGRRAMDNLESLRPEPLLTPGEVAVLFRVSPKTVTRWARSGKLGSVRTLGGHRRFRAAEVAAFLAQVEPAPLP